MGTRFISDLLYVTPQISCKICLPVSCTVLEQGPGNPRTKFYDQNVDDPQFETEYPPLKYNQTLPPSPFMLQVNDAKKMAFGEF